MRAAFGLVSLLVVLGVVLFIFKYIEAPTLEQGKKVQDQAQQISGRGTDGRSAMSSFKTEPQQQGSKLSALLVTDVTAGGAVDEYYGLKKGDRIISISTQAGMQKIGEASNDDPEMARIDVQQAFQGSQPIVVLRDGQQMTLPASAGSAQPATPGNSAPPAASSTPPPAPRGNPYDQANGIKDALQNR